MTDRPRKALLGLRTGLTAVAPLLVGVAPVGILAGATPLAHGMPWDVPVGFSTILFAGASQLAAIEVLTGGGTVLVAVITACTMNLRMAAYSASLAPEVSDLGVGRRLAMAYLLTDEAYAVSILRWSGESSSGPPEVEEVGARFWVYVGAGASLWVTWQVTTVVGVLVGHAVPDGVHLEFAVPLAFLALLVPTLTRRPAVVAAVVGAVGAVIAAQLGAGSTSVVIGLVAGALAGAVLDDDLQVADFDGIGADGPERST
ncbi:MAG: AzlC family ABC transporter permease [Actinobacteria bacterium]|nr:AzlC family ABC transporter permease [Actinomycetota bacterium]